MIEFLWKAIVMGVVEGLTEFLPVSSTGHLILTAQAIDYPSDHREVVEIFIQLGAILAVVWHYAPDLLDLVRRAPRDAVARDLLLKVLVAFLPAAVVGLAFHHAIEEHLFRPAFVAAMLAIGGVVILLVERRHHPARTRQLEHVTWRETVLVGVAQVASLLPGVSRAGATIVGGLLAGMSRPVATAFSFYLAIPTVGAASVYSLAKELHALHAADALGLAVGLVAAFVSALIVIRVFLAWVRAHDLSVFGWYRIAVGVLYWLAVGRS